MSTEITQCCDLDSTDTALGNGINGVIGILQALHGFHPEVVGNNTVAYNGCCGLQEVTFVVKTNLWKYKGGEVAVDAMLRPAITNGITKGMVRLKQRLEMEIANVEAGHQLFGVGTNKWESENLPAFCFMSLMNPKPYMRFSKTYNILLTNDYNARLVSKVENKQFVRNLETSTGCKIKVSWPEYPGQEPREIGFYGPEHAIKKARATVEEFSVSRDQPILRCAC